MISSKRVKSNAMADLMGEIDVQLDSLRRGCDPGEKVKGIVVSVGSNYVVVDINAKMQGVIERTQWADEAEVPEVGAEIEAYFVDVSDGAARLVLGGSASAAAMNQTIQQAYLTKLPMEGKIEKEINGGYEVTIAGQRAFCPFSQVGLHRQQETDEKPIGKTLPFLVVEYDSRENSFVVSHRALLEKDRAEKREGLKLELKEGDLRDGIVTKIMPFGVFVDIGGIEGLIPLRELSWDRTVKAEEILKEGQGVKVAILTLDWVADRFSLSLRDTLVDPWNDYAEEFGIGSYVTGKVVKLMPFGVFVVLQPGVEGLVPISRLGGGRRISHPKESVSEGDMLDLQIESIDMEKKRISLKVVDTRVRALTPGEIAVGAHIKGLVEGIREFGIFVRLSEEKTGLLHVSECEIERGGNPTIKMEVKFPIGQEIDVVVTAIDGDRISLSLPGKTSQLAIEETENVGAMMRNNNRDSRDSMISSIGSILDEMFKQ